MIWYKFPCLSCKTLVEQPPSWPIWGWWSAPICEHMWRGFGELQGLCHQGQSQMNFGYENFDFMSYGHVVSVPSKPDMGIDMSSQGGNKNLNFNFQSKFSRCWHNEKDHIACFQVSLSCLQSSLGYMFRGQACWNQSTRLLQFQFASNDRWPKFAEPVGSLLCELHTVLPLMLD